MATSANDLNADHESCAAWIARFLKARGVDRIFGLQGGHIQPIWDHAAQLGIRIIDVRHEVAAVHMAHAHAELTGELGVAMVTAGPGVTNTVTGVANASLARAPVLVIGGCTSRAQANLGPLQDIPHVDILRPVTRQSRTLRVADQVIREFDEGVARAFGDLGEPGPVYLEIPTDVLRTHVPANLVLEEWMQRKKPRVIPPDAAVVADAVEVLWSAKRPLVVTGRGARDAGPQIVRLLDALGAVYLDTQESRGLVPSDHPTVVGAMRAAAMTEADTVFLIGRKLDYQLGYGSPAVFPKAKFVRLADTAGELIDNRRGEPEIFATPALALDAIVTEAGNRSPAVDRTWTEGLQKRHRERSAKAGQHYTTGSDGAVDPRAIFQALRDKTGPDYIAIADGGDLLSFARVGLVARTYMDAGAFGCLGVGTPYAIAASLAYPDRQVVCV
jgi:acetolactate synthase I/II/III large subunit